MRRLGLFRGLGWKGTRYWVLGAGCWGLGAGAGAVKKFAQINADSRRFYWDAKLGLFRGLGWEGTGYWVLGTGY